MLRHLCSNIMSRNSMKMSKTILKRLEPKFVSKFYSYSPKKILRWRPQSLLTREDKVVCHEFESVFL